MLVSSRTALALALPFVLASPGGAAADRLDCDDFEQYAPGAALTANWRSILSPGSTVKIDGIHSFSGSRAVHFSHPAGAANRTAVIRKEGAPLFPVAGNELYGRMMVWLAQIPGSVHWNNVSARGTAPATGLVAQYNFGGQRTYMANYAAVSRKALEVDCWKSAKSALPVKRWVCLEWHYDGSKDEMHFWADSQSLDDVTVIGKGQGCVRGKAGDGLWHAPAFNSLDLGWQHWIASPTDPVTEVDLWIDDVAVGHSRVGCPAPSPTTH
jgi:hypothetical protein